MLTLADRVMTTGLDRQGGDLRDIASDVLDLSTCVNRYGPPPEVRAALRAFDPTTLRAHPFDAEAVFAAAYAAHCGTSRSELVVGRGITEFLGIMSRLLPARDCAVVTPDYTDTIRLFPRHLGPGADDRDSVGARLERVATAMRHHRVAVLSNPNNPLGVHLPRAELAEICRAHPGSTLVVDEAYADFTADRELSLIGCDLDNVVVLQAPNKPFGIAGVRTGALWTRNEAMRSAVRAALPNWPISQVDSVLAAAALGASVWVRATLGRLLATARRMEALLQDRFGDDVVTEGVPVHYRFVHHDDPHRVREHLAAHGVAVRSFSGHDRGRISGLRIVAPTDDEMDRLTHAVERLPAELCRAERR